MLAEAFSANPLHVALFGDQVRSRNERFFLDRLAAGDGPWLAAWVDGRIAGVLHWHVDDESDPPRVTLGPLGVRPAAQRHGIGSALMERYCREVDAGRRAGYLETDQLSNVAFYKRFAFAPTGEFTVGHVVQYVMWRPPLL